jgi:hypothetical protein
VKGYEIHELWHGYIITFTESFLKQYVHENILDEFPFLIAEVAPPSYPDREIFQIFDDLGGQLLQEYQSDSAYKFKVIGSLTVVLLFKIKERFWKAYDPLTEASTNSAIVLTFKRNQRSTLSRSQKQASAITFFKCRTMPKHSIYIPAISVQRSNAKQVNQ